MNALLIHNDNLPTSLINAFANSLKFDIPQSKMLEESYSFDREIHIQLQAKLINNQFDIIFLPYSLNKQNYLELSGLRLAAHIRLTPSFNHTNIPIVFIGQELPDQIAKLSDLGSLLFTTGVFTTQKQDFESLRKQHKWILENKIAITEHDLIHFKEKVRIISPPNYDTSHSIANELALLKWSEYIKCDAEIPEIKQNLQYGLFFKYIKSIYREEGKELEESFTVVGAGKILLIDDEADKGWGKFYQCFFKNSARITFDYLITDFKSKSREEIIDDAKKKIETFNPDLVLLDLRLCDTDFNTKVKQKPSDLTGYKILNIIKNINKGIQVAITTASNKIWNYEVTNAAGANGYIIKEDNSNASEKIDHLQNLIENRLSEAILLKKIAQSFSCIINEVQKSKLFSEHYKLKLQGNLEIAFKLLEDHYTISKYINYSYLQLFIIAEEFLKEDNIFLDDGNCYVVIENEKILVLKSNNITQRNTNNLSAIEFKNGRYLVATSKNERVDTNFKMSCVLLFKYGLATSGEKNWTKIYKIRNDKSAHPESSLVTDEEYIMLVDFLIFIVNEQNFNPIDKKAGLAENSMTDSIDVLKQKFKKAK